MNSLFHPLTKLLPHVLVASIAAPTSTDLHEPGNQLLLESIAGKKYKQAYVQLKQQISNHPPAPDDYISNVSAGAICDLAGHKKEANVYFNSIPPDQKSHTATGDQCDADTFLWWSKPYVYEAQQMPVFSMMAVPLLKRALVASKKEDLVACTDRKARILQNLGVAYLFHEDYKNAERCSRKAWDCYGALPQSEEVVKASIATSEQLAQALYMRGHNEEAGSVFLWAIEQAVENEIQFEVKRLVAKYTFALIDSKSPPEKFEILEDFMVKSMSRKPAFANVELNYLEFKFLSERLQEVGGKPLEEKLEEVRSTVRKRLAETHS